MFSAYIRSVQCLAQLLVIWVLLRWLGAHRTGKLVLSASAIEQAATTQELALWRERADRLRRVARFLPGANCLARSLTLSWWARRKGLAAEVHIGVKPTPAGVEAHAWSLLGGQLLDERAEIVAQFTRVPYPSTGVAPAHS